MPSKVFGLAKEHIFKDELNLNNDSFECRLVHTEPAETADVLADISAQEFADPTYTALVTGGDVDLPNKRIFYDPNLKEVYVLADPITYPGLMSADGKQIVGMVVVRKDAGDPTKRYLLCYNAFTTAYPPNGADLTVQIPTSTGVLRAK